MHALGAAVCHGGTCSIADRLFHEKFRATGAQGKAVPAIVRGEGSRTVKKQRSPFEATHDAVGERLKQGARYSLMRVSTVSTNCLRTW